MYYYRLFNVNMDVSRYNILNITNIKTLWIKNNSNLIYPWLLFYFDKVYKIKNIYLKLQGFYLHI